VARALRPLARRLPASLLAGEAYASLVRGFSDGDAGRYALDQFLRPFAQPAGRDALLAHLAAQRPDDTATLSLGTIRAPTVVMHGTHDPFVPAALARRLHAAIPGATLDLVAQGRHYLPLDTPDHVAAAVAAVLAR
jgi:pimeloyl-ACP methyl ester carboxylesterase